MDVRVRLNTASTGPGRTAALDAFDDDTKERFFWLDGAELIGIA